MAAYSGLTEAQRERLELLIEEAGEIIQCATKILRHGYGSYNPDIPSSPSNRKHLEEEILEMFTVYERMAYYDDLNRVDFTHSDKVWQKKLRYCHHQPAFHSPWDRPSTGHVNPYELLGKDK